MRKIVERTSKYDLVAVPVVDEEMRLVGVVTVDDVIDIVQEDATEDVQKLGGMEALDDPYIDSGFFTLLRKRAGWPDGAVRGRDADRRGDGPLRG